MHHPHAYSPNTHDASLNQALNQLPRPVYPATEVAAWEQRWFSMGNSSFGLMQQAAMMMANILTPRLMAHFKAGDTDRLSFGQLPLITIWCGAGNNGGDGYLLGVYLSESLASIAKIRIYQALPPHSTDARHAHTAAVSHGLEIFNTIDDTKTDASGVHIDALFGNGLDHDLSTKMIAVVNRFNHTLGLKIAVDLPSGLHPDTGMPLPVATHNDMTLCLMGYKPGVLMGRAKSHVGELICLPLIPSDDELPTLAWLDNRLPVLAKRDGQHSHTHKGDYGSVMIIGGALGMGGAVMMAAESALKLGAGRVTVLTHKHYHTAILSRLPALMVADLDGVTWKEQLSVMNVICIGMGLGRDTAAASMLHQTLSLIRTQGQTVVLDADALWHLASDDFSSLYQIPLPDNWICTPHHAEAARLLGTTADLVESDRIGAIIALQEKYGGQWLLKGANSLTIDSAGVVRICCLGNAKMATAGMGDTLAGMAAGILSQNPAPPIDGSCIHSICTLHAYSGDVLAHGQLVVDVTKMPHMAASILAHGSRST